MAIVLGVVTAAALGSASGALSASRPFCCRQLTLTFFDFNFIIRKTKRRSIVPV